MNLTTKKEIKAESHYGPGGRDCNCCGPAPKSRKKHDRSVKRAMKQKIKPSIMDELDYNTGMYK